jgi:hypothetical protein
MAPAIFRPPVNGAEGQLRKPHSGSEYDKAIALLINLRDLAIRQGRMTPFQSALGETRP